METQLQMSQEGVMTPNGILHPFRISRMFTALWIGQSLSRLGDSILFVIIPLVVYSSNKSTLAMGFVMTLLMLPMVILLPFTGLLVDRTSRVRLMMLSDGVRFLLLIVMTTFSALNSLHLYLIYIFAFAVVNIAFGGITVVLIPWLVKIHLSMPGYVYGLLTSFSGIGALIAAYFFGRKKQWRHRGILAYIGVFVASCGLTGCALIQWIPGLAICRWMAGRVGGTSTILLEGSVVLAIAILMLMVPSIRKFQ